MNVPDFINSFALKTDIKSFTEYTMRLINTVTLEFEEFFGDGTPEYTILSHRWETGEVLFEELHSPTGRKKKGYSKILDFCDEVRPQGYDYAWVDTCCINKKDSAELAEAVNSMFTWYKNSSTCVTYLSDFCPRPELGQQQFESDLAKSQWFRRGWTLQELIAPAQVEFYDSKWRYFGTKRDLAKVISKITGISKALLRGKRTLKSFSCAQKLSWAANRHTTRPEDRTYSLLGLFGVSLPLIYDGDGSRAFNRLQEEIIKNSTDQSIFAWVQHGPSPSIRNERTVFDEKCSVLAPSPNCFRFSSKIIPCPRKESDRPYSLTNSGLEITQPFRQVMSSRDEVLLEVSLDCYDEDKADSRISIIVMASKSLYPSKWKSSPSLNDRLAVCRVEPRYLGSVGLGSLFISHWEKVQLRASETISLRISPIFADSDPTWVADVSWMNDPQWEVETQKRMDLARRHIQKLYDNRARENKKARAEAYLGIGIVVFGAYALKKHLNSVRDKKYHGSVKDSSL